MRIRRWVVACLATLALLAQGLTGQAPIDRVIDGTLEVQYEDGADTARLTYVLNTGTDRIPLRFRKNPPRHLGHGSRVRVHGTMTGGTLELSSGSDGSAMTTMALASPFTMGEQSTLVILFTFADLATPPYSRQTAESVMLDVSNFDQENSFGGTSVAATVVGWYPIASLSTTCNYSAWAQQAEMAAITAHIDVASYPRRVYGFPHTTACGWLGLGTVGGGSTANPSKAWINDGQFSLMTLAHEMGHNFGLYHAHSNTCDSGGCTTAEYGDDHDVMGNYFPGHFNAFEKERLGWLNSGTQPTIQTVTTAGPYPLEAYETPAGSGAPKALKVFKSAIAGGNTFLYAEARTQYGVDSTLAPGVLIHSGVDADGNQNALEDVLPASAATDFILDPGQSVTFSGDASPITFTTLSFDGVSAVVAVTQSSSPCTYALGTQGQSVGSSSGSGNVTLTTASDCNWVARSNAGWITVTEGSTNGLGPANLQFTVAANTSTSPRVGTLTITGQTYTITQAGLCNYVVSPTAEAFSYAAGAGAVSVTTTAACNWTAVSNNGFITITGGASGSGNGTATFSVSAKAPPSGSRTGTMTVAGNTVTITQAGVSDTSLAAAAAGGAYGGTASLSATLLAGTTPLSGKTITFNLNGATVGSAATNASGIATLSGVSLTGLGPGSYAAAVSATFAGDATSNPSSGTAALTVSPKSLTAAVTVANKTYDRSTSATVTGCTLSGVIGGDVVTCAWGAAAFASAAAGNGKSVTVTGLTLGGAAAANYTLSTTATTTANIAAVVLTATVTAANKVYDGTAVATVTGCTLSGVIAGDVVTCAWGPATFDTPTVGTGKLVTITGLTLGGAAAGNYTLASTTATATAAITADTTPPTVPGSLTATPVSTTQILLAWTASSDAGGVTGYQVERCTGASCNTFALVLTVSAPGVTDTGLMPGTTYRYRLRATDPAGNFSGYSTVVTAVTPSTATITFVQMRSATPGASATTVSATYSGAQTAGNLNVVAIGWGDTVRTVASVTDSRGNVYAPAVGRTTTTGLSHTIYYAKNIGSAAAGSNTVTVTFSGAATYPDVRILEYAGADPAAPVDGTATGTGTGTASTTAAVVTTSATDLLFAGNAVTTATTAAGAGFTSRIITADGNIAEDRLVTAVGSYTASATLTSGTWVAQLVAFRAAMPPDTTAPTAPGSLTAAAVSATQVNLAWAAATDNVAVTGYQVERCAGTGCSTFVLLASPTGTSASDTGLVPGTPYSYRVRALDAAGNASGYSNTASATPLDTTAPTAPGTLTATAVSATQVSLAWTAATDDVGVTGYQVERCAGVGCSTFVPLVSPIGTSVNDMGLVPGTSYSYRVRALDAAGNAGGYSGTASATTPTATVTATVTVANKVYDAGTGAVVAGCTLAGVVGGDVVSCAGGAAAFASAGVGTGKLVTVTGITLSGPNAGHYTLSSTTATTTADITTVVLTAAVTVANKMYDGTTSATVTGCTLSGVIGGDVVTCAWGAASFSSASMGTSKPVTVTGITIGDANAGNYTLSSTSATTTANIAAGVLTAAVTVANKTYDGTTSATVTGCTLSGVIAGDVVTCTGGPATFASASVGTGKLVTVTGIVLGDANAGNYTLASPGATTTANISAAVLTATVTVANKTYDGTTSATVTGCTLSGVIGGDAVSCSAGAATFDSAAVGTSKPVTVMGITLSGTNAENYALASTSAATTAHVAAAMPTATVTVANKVYDGTTPASVTGCTLSGVIAGDVVTCAWGPATFDTRTVGTGKLVTVTGLTLGGANAGNYALSGTSATTTANITAAVVTATVTVANKTYDGTTSATVTGCTLSGVIAGDGVTCAWGPATFDTPAVGTGKLVTVTGLTLGGANGGNYTLSATSATTTANITAKVLTATVTAANKVYDGTTTATVTGCTLSGVIAGDVVTCAWGPATFDTPTVGAGKTVTVTGLTLGGAAAGNYTLASTTATTTAAITAPADTTPPTVPGSLTATAAGATQVTLAWTAATDNVAVTGYQVERCTGVSCSTFVQVLTTSSPGATDTGLTGATTYRYRVRAADAAGNLSGYSTVATVVTASAPTITFVQVRTATPGASATTVSATYSGAQTAGNLNVVAIGWGDTVRTVASVTDSRGNVYAPAVGRTTTTGLSHTIYYAKNIGSAAAGSNTVTVTFSGAAAYPDVRILEYAGADPTAPVDGTATGTGTGTASTTAAVVTTSATDLLFAGNVVATATTAAGAGFTSRTITADGNIAEDRLVTAVGSYTASATLTSGAWVAQLVAFRAAPVADTTAPTAPGSLTATPVSATQVNLAWTAATDNVGVTGYQVERCAGVGCSTFVQVLSPTGTSVSDTGLVPGTAYSYRVRAFDAAGNASGYSNTASATPLDTTAPTAPGSLTATAAGATQVNLAWTASTDNVGITGYQVERCAGAGCSTFVQVLSPTGTSITDAGVGPATSYSYRVRAADAAGNLSAYSGTASAATPTATVTATVTVASKAYDGTPSATVTGCALSGVIGSDTVICSAGTATFDSATVGTGKPITVTGLTLSGANAGNYTLSSTSATTTANIAAALLTATVTVANKTYDGTPSAAVTGCALSGVIAGDAVTCSAGAAAFDSASAGTSKPVTVTGVALSGAAASNYALSSPTVTTTASIAAVVLTATVTAANKTYDGTTSATVTGCTLSGVITGDVVTCAWGPATFASATVGNGKSVTVTGIALGGANAGNYTPASTTATTTADITAALLTATVTAANKAYDGTTTATVAACALSGVIGGDVVTCTWGTATFDTPAVGTGKLVTVTGIGLSSANAGNYTLASTTATSTAAITADTTPPTVPGNLTATAGGATQVTLAWTASNDAAGVTGYQVERCTGVSCSTFVQVLTTSSPGATDTGLTAATTYRYRVRATDAAGNLSGYSTVATVVTANAPTITFVQARSATPGASATTVSATYSGAQTAGNLNVVAIGWGDTVRTVASVTDSRGNVYAPAVGRTTTTGLSHTIYYAKNIGSAAAGSNTVTVTFSGAAAYPDVRILEYAGADQASPVDGTATGAGTGTSSTTAALVTTSATDLLFAANVVETATTGPGAGFTSRIITGDGNIAEDRLVTAVGSYTASATLTSGAWVAQLVAFRAAGSQ